MRDPASDSYTSFETMPSLLRLLDHDSNELWYVSEYHDGGTLDNHAEKYKGSLLSVLEDIRPVVDGVVQLHRAGAVHRDIKPKNIFVGSDGKLVLGDFGLVYVKHPAETRFSATHSNVGTHAWMPAWAMEERVEDVKPAFDVFSFGKLIWSMLSGKPVLNLWYYEREANNVARIFPDRPEMALANSLFSKCIVEEESQCLATAADLLNEIDVLIERLSKGPSFFELQRRACRICLDGKYVRLSPNEERNFGLNPGGTYKVSMYACDNCRHVELFYFDEQNPPPKRDIQ
jgi:serine/threonine protein kinase